MHRFGRCNTQDDGLVLGQVTHRDALHDWGVGGDVFRQHLPTSCPNGLSTACPSAMVLSCRSVKPPTNTPSTPGQRPRQPESQQHPVHVVEVFVQILQQQPRPQSVESRACQAGCTNRQIAPNDGGFSRFTPILLLLQSLPHASLDARRSLTVGTRHGCMQRRNALDLCPPVQRRDVAEPHQPSRICSKGVGIQQRQQPATAIAPRIAQITRNSCIGKARVQ